MTTYLFKHTKYLLTTDDIKCHVVTFLEAPE